MRFWLLLLICVSALNASATVSTYNVELSLFGKVGEATITVAQEGGEYVMVVDDAATGLAAVISGNERGRFVSRGKVVDGIYISDSFEQYQTNNSVVESNVFVFDHEQRSVTRVQDKNETIEQSRFNIQTMSVERYKTYKVTKKQTTLEHYTQHDPLSLSLSIPALLKDRESVVIEPVALAKKERKMVVHRVSLQDLNETLDEFHSKMVTKVVGLDSYELESGDEYGVYIGYDADGALEEVTTKQLYYVIGYGRIEKISSKEANATELLELL